MKEQEIEVKGQRSSNIELLRIVLMWMIVLWHLLVHGVGLAHEEAYEVESYHWTHLLVTPFLCFHVDCFIFISGYFGIKFKKEKFISLLLMLFFYCIVTMFADPIINHGVRFVEDFHWNSWQRVFPFSDGGWWFMTNYLILMILSTILNEGSSRITKRQFEVVLGLLFLFSISGFRYLGSNVYDKSILFVFIYLIGRYIRMYPIAAIKKHYGKILTACIIGLVCYVMYYIEIGPLNNYTLLYAVSYNNPFCLLASVCFFFVFCNLKIGYSRLINLIASGVLATYMITDGFLQMTFTKKIYYTVGDNTIILAVVAMVVVMGCSLFEVVRMKLFKPIEQKIIVFFRKA